MFYFLVYSPKDLNSWCCAGLKKQAWNFQPGLHCGWQKLRYLAHHVSLSAYVNGKLGPKQRNQASS